MRGAPYTDFIPVQISTSQLQQISRSHAQSQAAQLRHRVDAAVSPEQVADAGARLAALSDEIVRSTQVLGVLSPLLTVEIRQTAVWLQQGLDTGVAYRETRAAALLHGSAALGAMWFMDHRLLSETALLPVQATLGSTMAQLLASPQGARFKQAADKEQLLRASLRNALQRVFADAMSPASVQALAAAAFAKDQPDDHESDERAPLQPTASRFLARERALLAQAGIVDHDLQSLCVAGDLALGQGRCVRLATSQAGKLDTAALIVWLTGAVNALAGFQQ